MNDFSELADGIEGEVFTDNLHRVIYATDASAYRELPMGVVYPKNENDVRKVVRFAADKGIAIIPRAAGTSLAGQVVGSGLVMDISRYMNEISEVNTEERYVRVQPGVVLDELNSYLKQYGLFFGPETSTANRCCMGGMVGNNSCGSHSLVYGSTREHLIEAKVILSDGSEAVFKELNGEEYEEKLSFDNLEGDIYRKINEIVAAEGWDELVSEHFPDRRLRRRNSGYALDELRADKMNLCKILAGSEGTLAVITEIKLGLVDLPPACKCLLCLHCDRVEDAFGANLTALRHKPVAVELMDKNVLELSAKNIEQSHNRFFIKGEPAAILMTELAFDTEEKLNAVADSLEEDFRKSGYNGHCTRVYGEDIARVWALRKAGLGLLTSMPGSAKPVSVIEDTAVVPERLPDYMSDFGKMLQRYDLSCVYHAHIGTGELHLRPVLDLKKEEDVKLFRQVARETAILVKKYKGALSGEHGDGRLRGEFIPLMYGDEVFARMSEVKKVFDSKGILNPGKIVNTPSMNTSLRYSGDYAMPDVKTYFDFSKQRGWLSAIEQCNGSADCRRSVDVGGTMCPSYKATGDEKNTTRARANILRELLTRYDKESGRETKGLFSQSEILEALDLCLSCKACKAECPASVDMTRLKAEFMQHYYDENGVGLRVWMVGHLAEIQSFFSKYMRWAYNLSVKWKMSAALLKKILRFAPQRSLPILSKITLRAWADKVKVCTNDVGSVRDRGSGVSVGKGKLYLFADEFTNYMEAEIGIKFIRLMNSLGYEVEVPKHKESGRTFLSKGLLKKARKVAEKNVQMLSGIVCKDVPLIGIEPSCILSFRDEYPDLVGEKYKKDAEELAKNCMLFDEFIVQEMERGRITADSFTDEAAKIYLHGHCHQKALASVKDSVKMLSLPINYTVEEIPSGCCGMAGSFGYEKEHYDLSVKIGEQVLFPAVRNAEDFSIVSAPGTSCRQHIKDNTGREVLHPVEVLYRALK